MSVMNKEFLTNSMVKAFKYLNNKVALKFNKENKNLGISVAIAFALIYIIRDRVFKPPRNLRHIPYIGHFSIMKSVLRGDSLYDRGYKMHLPLLKSKNCGLYAEAGRYGYEIHISNPEDAKLILSKQDKFPKVNISGGNEDTIFSKFLCGPNLILKSGHEWKTQRKVVNPAFHRSMPVNLFGKITQEMIATMDKMDKTVNFSDLSIRWTLEAIGRAGFDFNFNAFKDIENNKWVNIYYDICGGLRDLRFHLLPVLDQSLLWLFPKRKELHNKLDMFLKMLDGVIENKRELLKEGNAQSSHLQENERDLLTLMIESEARGEGLMSNEELKSNLCLFFFAGHDTTASALSFTLYHLAKRPDLQEKVRQEVISILGDGTDDIIPTVEDTKKMVYTDLVIKETLRLNNPAVKIIPRRTTEDTVLSGVLIPKGSLLSINIFNIHHQEKFHKDSTIFNPDRFADNGKGRSEEGSAYLPFGSGARQCIGMNFSINEQKVVLAMLLRKYTWTLPENSVHKDDVIVSGFPIISPKDLELTFDKRY